MPYCHPRGKRAWRHSRALSGCFGGALPLGPWALVGREPDQRALQVIAAPLREQGGRLLVLHPFGHGLDPEPAREIDERVDEGTVVVGALEVLHEGTVDLDQIDAELAQIAERSMAGAEIVDG